MFHQIGRDIVRTLGKSPFQCYSLTDPFVLVCTLRGPCSITHHKCLRHIHHLVARAHTFLHSKGIKERLDGRSDLTLALAYIVILEVAVVRASYVSLDMSGLRLDGHESGTKMRLIVSDGIIRSHCSVNISLLVP